MDISPVYHNSRPEGALPQQETAAFDLLDSLGIGYERVTHGLADTMEKCDDVSAVLGVDVCKNLFLCNRQKTSFYLLMMPGEKVFKTKDLSKQLGVARLSFASPEDMLRLLNITPGSVSVLGLMNDKENEVQLVIDKPVLEDEKFGCHPVINSSTLAIATKDLMEKILPAVHHEAILVELPEEAVEA